MDLRLQMTCKKLLAGVLIAFCAVLPAHAADQVRIAFVNTPKILKEAPQAQNARERLKSEFAVRDQNLVESANELRKLEEKLSRDGAVMSETERRDLEREIVSERRELQRSRDEFTEDFNIRRNEEFAKLQRKVAKAIVDLAKKEGFDLILEAGVVYASDKVDITDQVIGQLKKQSGE